MGSAALKLFVVLVYAFLFLPIVVVVMTSFSASPMFSFPPTSFTIDWYFKIPSGFFGALKVSLIVATTTSACATILGASLGLSLARSKSRFLKTLVGSLSLAPLTVPHLVLGVGLFYSSLLIWDLTGIGLAGSVFGLILGHTAIAIPYVVRTVLASTAHFDRSVEEAALNLGASNAYVLRRISLPILLPGVISGGFFAFLVSFDEVPITIFMGGGDAATTLPLKILTSIQYDMSPNVMAIASMIIIASLAAMVVVERVFGLERLFGAGRA
jgi:putative spermidine/putrescine transport system permease protein